MTGDLFMTFKKEGKKTRKKQEEFRVALLLHLEAIPAMTERKKRKKKNETVADWRGKASRFVGIVQPLYLSRGPGFPRVHRAAAGCKKKKNLESSERRRRGEKFCIKALQIGPSTFSAAPKRGEVGSCCADRKILN